MYATTTLMMQTKAQAPAMNPQVVAMLQADYMRIALEQVAAAMAGDDATVELCHRKIKALMVALSGNLPL